MQQVFCCIILLKTEKGTHILINEYNVNIVTFKETFEALFYLTNTGV